MRRAHASQSLAAGAQRTTVRDSLRHAALATAAIYRTAPICGVPDRGKMQSGSEWEVFRSMPDDRADPGAETTASDQVTARGQATLRAARDAFAPPPGYRSPRPLPADLAAGPCGPRLRGRAGPGGAIDAGGDAPSCSATQSRE